MENMDDLIQNVREQLPNETDGMSDEEIKQFMRGRSERAVDQLGVLMARLGAGLVASKTWHGKIEEVRSVEDMDAEIDLALQKNAEAIASPEFLMFLENFSIVVDRAIQVFREQLDRKATDNE